MAKIERIRCINCQTVLGNILDGTMMFEGSNKISLFIRPTQYCDEIYNIKCGNCGGEFLASYPQLLLKKDIDKIIK